MKDQSKDALSKTLETATTSRKLNEWVWSEHFRKMLKMLNVKITHTHTQSSHTHAQTYTHTHTHKHTHTHTHLHTPRRAVDDVADDADGGEEVVVVDERQAEGLGVVGLQAHGHADREEADKDLHHIDRWIDERLFTF